MRSCRRQGIVKNKKKRIEVTNETEKTNRLIYSSLSCTRQIRWSFFFFKFWGKLLFFILDFFYFLYCFSHRFGIRFHEDCFHASLNLLNDISNKWFVVMYRGHRSVVAHFCGSFEFLSFSYAIKRKLRLIQRDKNSKIVVFFFNNINALRIIILLLRHRHRHRQQCVIRCFFSQVHLAKRANIVDFAMETAVKHRSLNVFLSYITDEKRRFDTQFLQNRK